MEAATTKQPPTGTSPTLASDSPPAAAPSSLGDASTGESEVDADGSAAVVSESPPHAARTGTPRATAAEPDKARRLLIAVMGTSVVREA